MYNRARTRDFLDPTTPMPDASEVQYPTQDYKPSDHLKVKCSRIEIDSSSVGLDKSSSSDPPVSTVPNIGPSTGVSHDTFIIPLPVC